MKQKNWFFGCINSINKGFIKQSRRDRGKKLAKVEEKQQIPLKSRGSLGNPFKNIF